MKLSWFGWDKGVSVPGAFKPDHLQPVEPVLFKRISNFWVLYWGGPIPYYPIGQEMRKLNSPNWPIGMIHWGFSDWGFQTGPFAACKADCIPQSFHLYTGDAINDLQGVLKRWKYLASFAPGKLPHAEFDVLSKSWNILGNCLAWRILAFGQCIARARSPVIGAHLQFQSGLGPGCVWVPFLARPLGYSAYLKAELRQEQDWFLAR